MGVNYFKERQKIGSWKAPLSTSYTLKAWDLTSLIGKKGDLEVLLQFTKGRCRVGIDKVELLKNGKVISSDIHRGVSGGSSKGNLYSLKIDNFTAGAKYSLRASIRSEGGTDCNGNIFINYKAEK